MRSLFQAALISQPTLCHSKAPRNSYVKAGSTPSSEDGVTKPFPQPVPFPAFLGGSGGASAVGAVGESVLVETKIDHCSRYLILVGTKNISLYVPLVLIGLTLSTLEFHFHFKK